MNETYIRYLRMSSINKSQHIDFLWKVFTECLLIAKKSERRMEPGKSDRVFSQTVSGPIGRLCLGLCTIMKQMADIQQTYVIR